MSVIKPLVGILFAVLIEGSRIAIVGTIVKAKMSGVQTSKYRTRPEAHFWRAVKVWHGVASVARMGGSAVGAAHYSLICAQGISALIKPGRTRCAVWDEANKCHIGSATGVAAILLSCTDNGPSTLTCMGEGMCYRVRFGFVRGAFGLAGQVHMRSWLWPLPFMLPFLRPLYRILLLLGVC